MGISSHGGKWAEVRDPVKVRVLVGQSQGVQKEDKYVEMGVGGGSGERPVLYTLILRGP